MCMDFWCVAVLSCGEQNRLTELVSLYGRIGKHAYVCIIHTVYIFGFEYISEYGAKKKVSVKPLNSMLTNIETLYGNRHHHEVTLGECKITRIYFECNLTLLVLRCVDILIYVCHRVKRCSTVACIWQHGIHTHVG